MFLYNGTFKTYGINWILIENQMHCKITPVTDTKHNAMKKKENLKKQEHPQGTQKPDNRRGKENNKSIEYQTNNK